MCGILGYWGADSSQENIKLMTQKLRHRGPDSNGTWSDPQEPLHLGHTRLSILDLTDNGSQPMVSSCGQFVLVFNGEIYNHLDIRKQLSHKWIGHSDTETLLAAITRWGIKATLKKLDGMFALAVWDRETQILSLARDRMGEKPLYFGINRGIFYFASELKVLETHSHFKPTIDPSAIDLYLKYLYIPSPYSIYNGVFKMKPGHYVQISNHGRNVSPQQCYWDIKSVAMQPKNERPFQEAVDELESLLSSSVKRRLMSDVPLGVFLSGGIDSSVVAALAQKQNSQPINTFSIGFNEKKYNEAHYAKNVAEFLGTNHHEHYFSANDALEVIPKLADIWDEPFSDSSQIPTFMLSKMTAQKVKVALSGDGGDELFYGYTKYLLSNQLWDSIRSVGPKKAQLAVPLLAMADGISRPLRTLMPKNSKAFIALERIPKLKRLIPMVKSPYDAFDVFNRNWHFDIMQSNPSYANNLDALNGHVRLDNFNDWMQLTDCLHFLSDDILTKVDRASMHNGLECRAPLLDHKIVEFAFGLPNHHKALDGSNKRILKEVLYRHIPASFFDRKKAGFRVPIEEWLKGPLKTWSGDLLHSQAFKNQHYLDSDKIIKMWEEHVHSKKRWHNQLWSVLIFQQWLQNRTL